MLTKKTLIKVINTLTNNTVFQTIFFATFVPLIYLYTNIYKTKVYNVWFANISETFVIWDVGHYFLYS